MRDELQTALAKGLDGEGTLGLAFYNAVQDMDADEMRESASSLADLYYTVDQVDGFRKVRHEQQALAVRTIFGDLSRNGLILSETHPDRGKDINRNESCVGCNWDKAFEFCEVLSKEFEQRGNQYGVMIVAEMVAHRYGDLSLVGYDFVDKMEGLYILAADIASKIQCQKQMFSPWYWGAFYFMKLGNIEKSIEWFKKYIITANEYMRDGQPSYRHMVCHSLTAMRGMMSKRDFRICRKWFISVVQNKQMLRGYKQFGI